MTTRQLSEDQYDVTPAPFNQPAPPAQLGSEVSPMGPRQDMFAVDILAGGPPDDRTASPAVFTGGDLERGLGGMANPQDSSGADVNGVQRGLPIGL